MKNLTTYISFGLTKKYFFLLLMFLSIIASTDARSAGQELQISSIELQVSEESTHSESVALEELEVEKGFQLHTSWNMFKFIMLGVVIVVGVKLERMNVLRRREQLAKISSQLFVSF